MVEFTQKKHENSFVSVMVDGKFRGAGVVVAPGRIVTSLHALDDDYLRLPIQMYTKRTPQKRKITVVGEDGNPYPVTVIHGNQSKDLILFDVPGYVADPIPFAQASPQKGDAISFVGRGESGPVESKGVIEALNEGGRKEPSLLLHNASMGQGIPGGALLNDQKELIGIQFDRCGVALPLAWVRDMLQPRDPKLPPLKSRTPKPQTEIDYYSISRYGMNNTELQLDWLGARPNSVFAVEGRIAIRNQPMSEAMDQLCQRYERYLLQHGTRQDKTAAVFYKEIADLNDSYSPLRLAYLEKSLAAAQKHLESAPDQKELRSLHRQIADASYEIGQHYAFHQTYDLMDANDAAYLTHLKNGNFGRAITYYKHAFSHAQKACESASQQDIDTIEEQKQKATICRPLIGCLLRQGRLGNAQDLIKRAQDYFGEYVKIECVFNTPMKSEMVKEHVLSLIDSPWMAADGQTYPLCTGPSEREALARKTLNGLSKSILTPEGRGGR